MSDFDYTKYGTDTLSEELMSRYMRLLENNHEWLLQAQRFEEKGGLVDGSVWRMKRQFEDIVCTALREIDRLRAENERLILIATDGCPKATEALRQQLREQE